MNGSITFHTWESAHVPEILQEIYIHKIYNRFMLGKKDGIFFDIGFISDYGHFMLPDTQNKFTHLNPFLNWQKSERLT